MFQKVSGLIALTALALLMPPTAPAHEIHWEGEVRVRGEADDRSFQSNADFNYGIYQRTRIKGEAKNDKGAHVLIQLQDSRKWGDEGNTLADTENIDLHQAFVRLTDPNFDGVEWTLGRQELHYGSGRVFSKFDWSNVGRAFDAARVRFHFSDQWIDIAYAKISEDQVTGTDENVAFGIWHIEAPEIGLQVEPMLIYKENSSANQYLTSVGNHARLNRGRIRVYQDFIYQTGEVGSGDAKAYLLDVMAAVDISQAQDGSAGLGAGYSMYTGDDPSDADDSAYDNLYYDAHKYHGYMDLVTGIVDGLGGVGLKDVFGKAWVKTASGVWLNGGVHVFSSDIDIMSGSGDRNSLGTEIDVVVGKELESGLSAQIGGGMFSPGDVVEQLIGDETAYWAYLQGTAMF